MAQWIGSWNDPDRYALQSLVSRGGEGELWRASVLVDGQELPVAVKIITSEPGQFDTMAERARNQAELLRSLEHPNLVKVREVFDGPVPHDYRAADSSTRSLYLVMNWAVGMSLAAWVGQHPDRDALECTRVVTRVAAAVDYLHSGRATGGTPVLHRDIKPANVIVNGADVRLVDFGFARLSGTEMTVAGTPGYMAPEVLAGAAPSEASDRYGLGATAYFLFTGDAPDGNQAAMRTKLMAANGIEGRQDFAEQLLAMVARDPSRRPSNVAEWAQSLAVGAVSERMPTVPTQYATSGRGARRRSRRGLLIGAVIVVLLLAGAAGALLRSNGGSSDSPERSRVASATTKTEDVPDVIGLSLEQAKKALRAAGYTNVAVKQQDSNKDDGTVLAQVPMPGSSSASTVTLTVARKVTTLPDLTGKTLSDAKSILEGLGVTVNTTDVVDNTKTDGTVISQDPAGGAPLPVAVTLRIARTAVVTYLADLDAVNGDTTASYDRGVATISGQSYAHSVTATPSRYDLRPQAVAYDLGRRYLRFQGTVGLTDRSPSDAQIKVEVLGDGRPLFAQTITLGQAVPIDVDVTNVLRLQIVATNLKSPSGNPYIAWGDARLLGSPSQVPGYATPSTTLGFGTGSAVTTTRG